MTVGSLFAGIGGFDLGFERAGFEIKWQVEIDPFATAVLAQHWPEVERFDDVRAVGRIPRRCVPEPVDVLCGGFPCQDISVAGRGAGIDGERSGLWSEFDRLIGELRPRYVVVENVSALLARGLGRVLGDLSARGFDAEWDCLPASAFGAPHQRDRLWLVAYAADGASARFGQYHGTLLPEQESVRPSGGGASLADTVRHGQQRQSEGRDAGSTTNDDEGSALVRASRAREVADTEGQQQSQQSGGDHRRHQFESSSRLGPWAGTSSGGSQRDSAAGSSRDRRITAPMGRVFSDADGQPARWLAESRRQCGQWLVEPDVGRVAHGVPARVDRLRGLGNAVVPQITEWIARRILEAETGEVAHV